MESYRIIRDPQDQRCRYDFTFGNGVNVQVQFELLPNDSTGQPAAGGATELAVYDSNRDNITEWVLKQFRECQSGAAELALHRSAVPVQSHEVENLIHFIRGLKKPEPTRSYAAAIKPLRRTAS